MERRNDTRKYFVIIGRAGLYSSAGNLRFHIKNVFNGIDFAGKRVLDIGGGNGVFSFYAASSGAEYVICLEPEDKEQLPGYHRDVTPDVTNDGYYVLPNLRPGLYQIEIFERRAGAENPLGTPSASFSLADEQDLLVPDLQAPR